MRVSGEDTILTRMKGKMGMRRVYVGEGSSTVGG